MCGKRGQRQTGEGNRQRNVFGSQMLSPFCRIIMSRTLYFFSCRTHTHTHISTCWGVGQPDMFGTNMLIVYFLFIFSNILFSVGHFFFCTRTPAERRQSPGAPLRLLRQRACSVFRSTNWVTVSERQKPAAALPRRRALHLISHLHRKHPMVNRLAISPGGTPSLLP